MDCWVLQMPDHKTALSSEHRVCLDHILPKGDRDRYKLPASQNKSKHIFLLVKHFFFHVPVVGAFSIPHLSPIFSL